MAKRLFLWFLVFWTYSSNECCCEATTFPHSSEFMTQNTTTRQDGTEATDEYWVETTPTLLRHIELPDNASYPQCRMGYVIMDYLPTEEGYYQHQTCYWCYHFVPVHRRKYSLSVLREVVTLADKKPRFDLKFAFNNESYHFDPDEPEGWDLVVESLADSLEAVKLESCCREAVACCQRTLQEPPSKEGECPATWDGWMCFPSTVGGVALTFTCPSYAYKGQPECTLKGRKRCWENGTWAHDHRAIEQTEYGDCSHQAYHARTYGWELAMHVLSIVALVPAIFLILYFRKLRVQRFYLHLNLFVSLFGKAFFSVLDLAVLRIPEYTGSNSLLDENTAGCRLLVFLAKFFGVAVWSWMLAESVYLHRLIVAAFRGGGKTYVYLITGWAPAAASCLAWAGARASLEDTQCWLGHDALKGLHLYLITELPKMIILIVNTLLLANMTRVLLTKLKGVNTDSSTAIRRAVKATMFLLPLFGVQFFSTFFIPPKSTSCVAMQVYTLVATSLDGLQGFYVATVYCFINKEVKQQVRRSLHHMRGRFATDKSFVTYDPRTDVSLLHSVNTNSVV